MSRQLIIKIAPDETIRFPALCTNCAQPAAESMELVKRNGRTRRQVNVPICEQCAAQLHKNSAAEERMRKQSWLFAGVIAFLILIAALLLLPGAIFWLRFLGLFATRACRRCCGAAVVPRPHCQCGAAREESGIRFGPAASLFLAHSYLCFCQ